MDHDPEAVDVSLSVTLAGDALHAEELWGSVYETWNRMNFYFYLLQILCNFMKLWGTKTIYFLILVFKVGLKQLTLIPSLLRSPVKPLHITHEDGFTKICYLQGEVIIDDTVRGLQIAVRSNNWCVQEPHTLKLADV